MKISRGRSGWVGRVLIPAALFSSLLTGCATTAIPPSSTAEISASEEDDFSQLIAQMRADLSRHNARLLPNRAARSEASIHAAPLTDLRMPIVGITARNLGDSWGAPRDGGKRSHRGIDIFAPRGAGVVAVADGVISYIGDQPKGGHCLWLSTESGTSFYYAHLDRWAPGIYEGLEVKAGTLLGFVGNTGNAVTTPPHLHFSINQNDEMVNPYPVLARATPVQRAEVHRELAGGYGTR